MQITVIYGPPASGKTRNSDRLAQHYRKHVVVDEGKCSWDPRPFVGVKSPILFLTQLEPTAFRKQQHVRQLWEHGATFEFVAIEDALRAIGASSTEAK